MTWWNYKIVHCENEKSILTLNVIIMKKRISLLSLCLGLFIAACTDISGFEDWQKFSEKEVMPRAAGDGI